MIYCTIMYHYNICYRIYDIYIYNIMYTVYCIWNCIEIGDNN